MKSIWCGLSALHSIHITFFSGGDSENTLPAFEKAQSDGAVAMEVQCSHMLALPAEDDCELLVG